MDTKTKNIILSLLPVRYSDEQKNQEMIEKLTNMCAGDVNKLQRYLKRFPKLFKKECLESLYSDYNRVYSDMMRKHPGKSHQSAFGDITIFLFERATGLSWQRNNVALKLFRSMISRRGYLPSRPKATDNPKIKDGVQISLGF